MAAALADLGRVALDVLLAVGPWVSSEHVAKSQHVVQMRHSRLESFQEGVRDMLDEHLDSSQNLTLKSTLLFGFCTAILVEGFPPQKMESEMCVDVFLFLVPWGICWLFQSMTFAVLYQRGMMTVGHHHLRDLQRIATKQAEEEILQGSQTFVDVLENGLSRSQLRRQEKRRDSTSAVGFVARGLWGIVARLFALPTRGDFQNSSCSPCNSDEEQEDFCSLSGGEIDGEGLLEHQPASERAISLDYLLQDLQSGRRSATARTTSPERAAAAEVESEVATLPSGLVHVKEWAKMEEVTALENYVDQAQRTVEAGGLFTLAALGFCIFYHLEMRAEHYQEHQMALAARCGIFLPPLMVGAFVSSIRPFPDKLRYRESALDPEDCRNPHIVVKAVQCLVFFCALISCTALAFALQIHAPVPKPLTPSVSVSELKIDHWPLFFYPTGVTGVQEDSLLLTTDFAVARFQLGDAPRLVEERRLPGLELSDAAELNTSILLMGRNVLYHLPVEAESSELKSVVLGDGKEAINAGAYWRQRDLLFLAPSHGVVAVRGTSLDGSEHLRVDFRLALQEAVLGLAVNQEEQLLYALLQRELLIFDLDEDPGAVLRRLRLPEENVTWSGIASLPGGRLFAVTHRPAKIWQLQLPSWRCHLRSCGR